MDQNDGSWPLVSPGASHGLIGLGGETYSNTKRAEPFVIGYIVHNMTQALQMVEKTTPETKKRCGFNITIEAKNTK
jgi:hypothetical protein